MAINSLTGHMDGKFAAVTVFDATLYDTEGNPLITFDTLQVSNISSESEQKEIRGGRGANLLLTYDYGRTATVEITDALASMHSLQYLWGAKLQEGLTGVLVREVVDIVADGEVPMPANLTLDTITKALHIDGTGITEELELTITEGSITGGEAVNAGDQVVIYGVADIVGGHELVLTADDFPEVTHLVGETFFIDQKTGKKKRAQIEIPKFKPDANFEFTFEAEGDASVFDFTGTAMVQDGQIMKLKMLGDME